MIVSAVRQFFVIYRVSPCRIAVAASGGIDSTALLLAMAALREEGFDLVCTHVNHHLRGAESDADEGFVRDLCARLGISLHVSDGTLSAEAIKQRGVEAAAREIRYERLTETRLRSGALYVATAHQKNDQAETVLMRLLGGSGTSGLRGIRPIRADGFVRPLLEVTRDEIAAFLEREGVTARDDLSNADPRFLRNRIRPIIRELGCVDGLAAVAAQAQLEWPVLEQAIDSAERACAIVMEKETRFTRWPENAWLRQELLRRHIRRLDPEARDFDATRLATEVERIKRVSVTKTLELVRLRDMFVLRRPPEPIGEFEVEVTPDAPAYIPELDATMHVAKCAEYRRLPAGPADRPAGSRRYSKQHFQLPHGARAAFTVRNRRPADRFHPLGLRDAKKLKDFLIDRKIAADVRDRLPLLIWNDEIVWIAGVEISERFKVTSPERETYAVWLEGASAEAERDAGLH
jgi:tRNA(Ile)-lysidine synthase